MIIIIVLSIHFDLNTQFPPQELWSFHQIFIQGQIKKKPTFSYKMKTRS